MKLLIFALTAVSAIAAPILPDLINDGVPVPMDDPRIGAYVYAIQGSHWEIFGNDNPPPTYGDHDYNDAVMEIRFDPAGFGTATWIGANSAWTNYWTVEGQTVALGFSAIWRPVLGEQVDISLVTQYGAVYAIGSKNVLTDQHTPEPGAMVMVLIGGGLMLLRRRRRRINANR